MNKPFLFLNIFLCLTVHVTAQKKITSKNNNDIQQITAMEYAWIAAENRADTVAISKMLDDRFISIDYDIMNRQQELTEVHDIIGKRLKAGWVVDSFRLYDVLVHVYDKTAVVTFINVSYGKNKGIPFTRRNRISDVLVKQNGAWKGAASHVIRGIKETPGYAQLKIQSSVWNSAYNNRDSLSFYSLLDSTAIITSGGARQVGKEECKNICRKLWSLRPDISWKNEPTTFEINEQGNIAYETGNWTESWTEKGDSKRSEIRGKYFTMWKLKNDKWVISSAIFTPLVCTGSYCDKK
ncbi:MAG: nuclear transport factor 2 family protein [Bacteroidota bacterium]|nr:nuclear transport factor 2 family protein [Bacteroidota bacterium]